ncbi:4-(cytidine 5'-diphospho)-2-C-methyl-D-erythritol kinase [Haloferula chungangensis]|uniref:4-diphosphocytidyl-2-C-methyl-D-erythritol kinase n=1 Tax=Haloferula chungangensis TaxID=1048331 RepID=A0ABW2L6P8_9BACT
MNASIDVTAPAKLNLSLRVLKRRDDGFHEIESLMVRLPGLHDRLSFRRAEEDGFTCNREGLPLDESNLVIKALSVFRRETRMSTPLAIHLEKVVPHGAGLGGGSSDAAATLSALDRIHGTGLGHDRLCRMAAEIGSDVPFFLGSSVARVGGRGERVEQAADLPRIPVLLLKPDFGVSTPDAYKGWKDSKELPGVSYGAQHFEWGELVNDLERPVFQKHLFLAEMKMWLLGREGVEGALMSGSGSTMFALVDRPERADEVVEAARNELDPKLWAWMGELGG